MQATYRWGRAKVSVTRGTVLLLLIQTKKGHCGRNCNPLQIQFSIYKTSISMERSQVLQIAMKKEHCQEITVHKTTKGGPNQMALISSLAVKKCQQKGGEPWLNCMLHWKSLITGQIFEMLRYPQDSITERHLDLLPSLIANAAMNAHCKGNLPAVPAKAG